MNFERLKQGDPVHFALAACLIVRRPGTECGVCREACPAGVLSGGQWSVALETDGCVGCGLCAAACPTGALKVEGCTPGSVNATGETIVLECRRVTSTDRDPNAVVVPCLGGLTTPDLLDFLDETKAMVVLADRGWCADCAIGRCSAPWQSALDESRALLGATNASLVDSIAVERKELPIRRAAPTLAALRPDKPIGRRDFLQRFVGSVEPRDTLAESRRVVFGRGLVEPIKHRRILGRIDALAADPEHGVAAKLAPAIKISGGCELSLLCAAICPTGALRRSEGDDSLALQFDAADCIACGECQRVCPTEALILWPTGDGTARRGPTILAERRTAACASCGDSFLPVGGEQTCPTCNKGATLMRELASLKSGSADSRR